MLENATRICDAKFGFLFRYDDGAFQPMAMLNVPSALADFLRQRGPYRPEPGLPLHRLVQTKKAVHTIDQATEKVQTPSAKLAGARSHISVPMLKEGEIVGAISIYRQEVRPFSDKQIELLTNFASQAVIAIENTRLLNELRESLQQQTATADVLKIISSSPSDLQPVFEAMLGNASHICQSKFGVLWLAQDDGFRPAAIHNLPPALTVERQQHQVMKPVPEDPLGQLASTKQILHILDCRTVAAYQNGFGPFVALVDDGGARTLLVVPLLREEELLGAFAIFRQEVRPFTDKQIELVKNFAAQAVIAIENTRLLNELRESLAQQTATADVLKVISRSPGQLEPVFQTLLENAVRVIGSKFGTMYLREGGAFRISAIHGAPSAFVEAVMREPLIRPAPESAIGRTVDTKQVVQFA